MLFFSINRRCSVRILGCLGKVNQKRRQIDPNRRRR